MVQRGKRTSMFRTKQTFDEIPDGVLVH
jgi:hypothetical protein